MNQPPEKFHNGLTAKSLLIAVFIFPVNVFWIIQLEVVRYTHPTLVHPLSNVIFIVFWLVIVGYSLRIISPKIGLTQQEVLTVYIMLCVVSSLCSHDMIEILVTLMGHPFRFATAENEWRDLFWRQLPEWLVVSDEKVLKGYYEGASSLYVKGNLNAWIMPSLWWITFIFVLLTVMLCINTLLRIQWTERERLTYPIIQLALEVTGQRLTFFRNKLMWFGFALASLISILNLLNSIFPELPYIPVKRQSIHQYFASRPWNAMGGVRVAFYPFVIGISFLIPLDLLFSCWFFYWLYKIELMVGKIIGMPSLPRFPYANEQGFGAYIALLVFALWVGRSHFKTLLYYFLQLYHANAGTEGKDDNEPIPYRLAFLGIIIGLAFQTVFSYKIGMAFWVIPIFFAIYFLLAIMIARLRAELGFLVHDLHRIDPHSMIITGFGTRRLDTGTLIAFSVYMFFNRAYRAHPMPQQLEALKISSVQNINPKQVAISILVAVFMGSIVTFWLLLDNYYRYGAESGYYGPWALGFGRQVYNQLTSWMSYRQDNDLLGMGFAGIGLSLTSTLMILRTRFLWWPLHPLGYAMANSWGMSNLWSCLLVVWLIKLLILRHGGLKLYRRAIPFFLGVALGDYIFGGTWSIGSILTNTTLYQFWP